jgi:hypothetical protein
MRIESPEKASNIQLSLFKWRPPFGSAADSCPCVGRIILCLPMFFASQKINFSKSNRVVAAISAGI